MGSADTRSSLLENRIFPMPMKLCFLANIVVLGLINSVRDISLRDTALREALIFMGLVAEGKKLVDEMRLEAHCVEKLEIYGWFLRTIRALGETRDVDEVFTGYFSAIELLRVVPGEVKEASANARGEIIAFFSILREIALRATASPICVCNL